LIPQSQAVESIMNGQQFLGLLGRNGNVVEFGAIRATAAFLRTTAAGTGDENLTHDMCSHAEEMSATLKVGQFLPDELEIGFVDESRGLVWGCPAVRCA
jgi:hypothetical protein